MDRADLTGAAVDQQQVGPGLGLAVGVFLQQAGEAAGQDFLHHAEVVAGGDLGPLDVELAVLALDEALGAGDDHAADGIGAHDVAVVIDLDPARGCGQIEGLGHALQQTHLGGAFRHAPRQAFAGVAGGVGDQLGLFAALRDQDLDLAAGAFREHLGGQIGVLGRVGQQDLTRGRLVVVELHDEGLHHLVRAFGPAKARIEIAVAPALVAADEEDLHAGLPAFHVHRDDICLGHALGVDGLHRLHGGQRLDAVAQGCGAFVFHVLGGLGHLGFQVGLNGRGLALQKAFRVVYQRVVIGRADPTDAGAAAAFDLEQQAGARARFEGAVGAVAQQEHPLQLGQRPIDRPRAGEGAVIVALFGPRAAMLLDLRVFMRLGHKDVRKGFVVAQQHVVARLQLLDQVLLQQQGLGLGVRGQEHHAGGFADHPRDASRMPRGAGVIRYPCPQITRLADIEHRLVRIQHAIDAGAAVDGAKIVVDQVVAGFLGHVAKKVILGGCCKFRGACARRKLSTESVDNSVGRL